MDIQAKIEELVSKIKADPAIAAQFTKEPVKTLEGLLGINLPDDQIQALINGIKAKLSLDQAGDMLGNLKKLF
ncbi:MAG: hypothetical protein LRY35_03785 [Clostridiales bacterium]|nr:hypothetical protein [Clostridiales bacterium]